jgi:hypothetical protein
MEVACDFIEKLPEATVNSFAPGAVTNKVVEVGDEARQVIYVPAKTDVCYEVVIPPKSRLEFGCAASPDLWDKPGDGVLFEVLVNTGADREVIVHSRYIDAKGNPEARRWFDDTASLTAFEGQRVVICFSTKPGPADDSRYDGALWSRPVMRGLSGQ